MNSNTLAILHNDSYSKASGYYLSMTDSLKQTRESILSCVLLGENEKQFGMVSVGPMGLDAPALLPLDKMSRILDVGCGTGDNLDLMFEQGYHALSGIDIAHDMAKEAKFKNHAEIFCEDVLQFAPKESYDLVFAQAMIHLFPKDMVEDVVSHLLKLTKHRFYFSTTLHDTGQEGIEQKGTVMRYRSRYTLQEILSLVEKVLAKDPNLSFHYFTMKDPLGKFWINGIFERRDIKKIYDEDGLLLYRGLHRPEEMESHQQEFEEMKERVPQPGTIMRYDSAECFDRVENFIPYCSEKLQALFTNEKVTKIITSLLGDRPVLLKDKLNYKLPGAGAFVPHQDAAAGWQQYGDSHLTFALGIDEATVENGALYFAPGEHKNGLLSPLKTPLSQKIVERLSWRIIPTKPGDALFFDSYTPHYSEANGSQKARKMAFLTYIASRHGDHREAFFLEKRKRQPPIDERDPELMLQRDPFGKVVRA